MSPRQDECIQEEAKKKKAKDNKVARRVSSGSSVSCESTVSSMGSSKNLRARRQKKLSTAETRRLNTPPASKSYVDYMNTTKVYGPKRNEKSPERLYFLALRKHAALATG